ncbi:hypothetical protein ACH5AO_20835 [Streptomyces sp. NPDC018964]
MTLKEVVDTLLGGDVTRVRSCAARFAEAVHRAGRRGSGCGAGTVRCG